LLVDPPSLIKLNYNNNAFHYYKKKRMVYKVIGCMYVQINYYNNVESANILFYTGEALIA